MRTAGDAGNITPKPPTPSLKGSAMKLPGESPAFFSGLGPIAGNPPAGISSRLWIATFDGGKPSGSRNGSASHSTGTEGRKRARDRRPRAGAQKLALNSAGHNLRALHGHARRGSRRRCALRLGKTGPRSPSRPRPWLAHIFSSTFFLSSGGILP